MSVAPLSNTIWRGLPGLFVRRNGTFSVQRQRLAFGVWRRSELRFQHGLLQISELRDLCVFVVISTLCVLPSPSVSSPVRFELSQIRTILDRLSGQLTWR